MEAVHTNGWGAPGAPSTEGDGLTLAPGQVLAAPQPQRLLASPPPRVVTDAVPLDVDALEVAAQQAARRRPMADEPVHVLTTAELLTLAPTPLPADVARLPLATPVPAGGLNLFDDDLDVALDLFAPVAETPPMPEPAIASSPVASSALSALAGHGAGTPVGTTALAARAAERPRITVADLPTPAAVLGDTAALRRRPAATFVGAVLAFAGVAVGTAMWVQQHRSSGDTAAPATSAVVATSSPTIAGAASTVAPTPATSAAPATTVAPAVTEAPAPTAPAEPPASSLPATTEAPATTVAEPAATTPTSVLGTSVSNRDVLDGLGKGLLTGGQQWPIASFVEGKIVLEGVVPSDADMAVALTAAQGLLTPDAVVNKLTIDPSAQSVRYLRVQLFDNPMFDRGSSKPRKDSEPVFELWAQRLRQKPGTTVLMLAHGDGAVSGTSNLAVSRAKAASARLLQSEGVTADRFQSLATAGVATGPRLDFAVPMG